MKRSKWITFVWEKGQGFKRTTVSFCVAIRDLGIVNSSKIFPSKASFELNSHKELCWEAPVFLVLFQCSLIQNLGNLLWTFFLLPHPDTGLVLRKITADGEEAWLRTCVEIFPMEGAAGAELSWVSPFCCCFFWHVFFLSPDLQADLDSVSRVQITTFLTITHFIRQLWCFLHFLIFSLTSSFFDVSVGPS